MTSDAEYAVLNSQLPLGQGAVAFLRADNHFVTLAHVLHDAGYATLSAHPYKKGFWNRAVLHPRYGFERSLFAEELGPGPDDRLGSLRRRLLPAHGPRAGRAAAAMVRLPRHPQPAPPLRPLPRRAQAAYASARSRAPASATTCTACITSTARWRDLFAALDEAGLADDTIVAIYGDHDSRLPHTPELLRLAGIAAWTPAVPLQLDRIAGLVVLPGGQARGEVDAVGGHIDLAPTLLHYLGISAPRAFAGEALLPGRSERGFAAFSDGSAIGGGRAFTTAGRGVPLTGACFEHPSWRPLPLRECEALAQRAQDTLYVSRAVADHDLAHDLAALPPATPRAP